MTGTFGFLLLGALNVAVSRAETIKIILDTLIDPHVTDSKPWELSFIEVSDQITVRDLVEKANFYGQVYYDDWDWHRNSNRVKWSSDNGNMLNDAYSTSVHGPYGKRFNNAFYGGKMMRPSSTLRSNGVKEMSTVLLSRYNDDGKTVMNSSGRAYVKVTYNNRNEYMYFYRREDLWNLFNLLTHRYGAKIGDTSFDVPTMGWMSPNTASPFADDFKTLGKIKDDSGKNPFTVTMERIKKCKCLSSSQYGAVSGEMTKRLIANKYGLGCSAHDSTTKTCSKKNIDKGNRKCWCPRKWCYVEDGCGSPSVKFPGLTFSYDICSNNDQVDCFATDTEGVEEAILDDFEMWTFPKVSGYLQKLVEVLADTFPSLQKKFGLDG